MRQTQMHLTDEDRALVDDIRSKGLHQMREVNRAHVLSCLDRGVPEAQIMAVLGVGRTAVWRARAAYLQGGVDLAVFDVARSGRPRRYDTDDEARVTVHGRPRFAKLSVHDGWKGRLHPYIRTLVAAWPLSLMGFAGWLLNRFVALEVLRSFWASPTPV